LTVHVQATGEIPDNYDLESVEQLQALGDPVRYSIIVNLAKPRTGAQLGRLLKLPRTKVHYHLKLLEQVGLIHLHSLGSTGGLAEKYYRSVARHLSFSKLLAHPNLLDGGEVSMATYQAAAGFLATMLNASGSRILSAPANVRIGEGFWLDFTTSGTEQQIAELRRKMIALRDEVVALGPIDSHRDPERQRRFTITLYLTPDFAAPAPAGKLPRRKQKPR
jgi:DNA-binding transcriptional ArsR family regulator